MEWIKDVLENVLMPQKGPDALESKEKSPTAVQVFRNPKTCMACGEKYELLGPGSRCPNMKKTPHSEDFMGLLLVELHVLGHCPDGSCGPTKKLTTELHQQAIEAAKMRMH